MSETNTVTDTYDVFLGGSCNPTTWRFDVAIPALKVAEVTFYNPQVDDWSDELVAIEAAAKANSQVLLFVIDGQTRAIASMLEAVEYILTGREVVVVINDIVDGTVIDGQAVTGAELKDLNRARAYLRDIVARHQDDSLVTSFDTVEDAIGNLVMVYGS